MYLKNHVKYLNSIYLPDFFCRGICKYQCNYQLNLPDLNNCSFVLALESIRHIKEVSSKISQPRQDYEHE